MYIWTQHCLETITAKFYVTTKLKRANVMACSAKLDITFHMTINILFYIFVSHDISYGCQIWGQSRSTYINKIIKLQNRALRITNFATYDADSNPLAIYLSNKILKLEDIIKLQNCLRVYD